MPEDVYTIVESSLQSVVSSISNQHLQSIYNKVIAKNKPLSKHGFTSFQIALAIYQHIINQASLSSVNQQYIAACEYMLSRLFTSLEVNPFASHFLSLKDDPGTIGAVVRAILLRRDVRNCTLSSLQVDDTIWDTNIDIDSYIEILSRHWLNRDEITRVLDPAQTIYDLNINLSLDNKNYQLLIDQAVFRTRIESVDVIKLFPHKPITFTIIDKFLQVESRATLKQLARMQANNATTDFLFLLIVDNHIDSDDTRVLIYEFVLYNLQQSTVYDSTVRLLSRFVLSLARTNVLQPLDNFSILFSSFINWIGSVDEAKQVYMLGKSDQ